MISVPTTKKEKEKKKIYLPHEAVTPPSPVPPAPDLLIVSTNLPVLDISYKWNHVAGGPLCLASFTQHHVFEVHPHSSTCQLSLFLAE